MGAGRPHGQLFIPTNAVASPPLAGIGPQAAILDLSQNSQMRGSGLLVQESLCFVGGGNAADRQRRIACANRRSW